MKKATDNRPDEWFREWFDRNYDLVYSHRTDEEAEGFVANWRLDWRELEGKFALDIGCGNGRFCAAMARRRLHPVGIDISRDQLKLAGQRKFLNGSVSLIRADMRQLPVRNCFSLITSLFTSFGYFNGEDEHKQLLKETVARLLPNGILIIDLPNRDYVLNDILMSPKKSRDINGLRIIENRRLSENGFRAEKEIFLNDNNEIRHYRESIRLFSADELLEMTASAGLIQTEALWGDYMGNEVKPNSPRMVYFGRKNG